MESILYSQASERYDEYQMDQLPAALKRNSLDYYYLSVYPSLQAMQNLDWEGATLPKHPASMRNAYLHIPFCSGICNFCSYYVHGIRPGTDRRLPEYLDLVEQEIDFHRRQTALQIGYLYVGGGTPSLISPDLLKRFLGNLGEKGVLAQEIQGTLELHPEFFRQRHRAEQFLDTLKEHGISRVSLGLQSVCDEVLSDANRRHNAEFIQDALALLRQKRFFINLDLIYGLPGMTAVQWERSLNAAVDCFPDSISTYFLFVDPGTKSWHQVKSGKIVLPAHREVQIQHLMGQIFLQKQCYHELPSDFHSTVQGDFTQYKQESLPSSSFSLPIGAGSYGFYDGTQFYNQFDLRTYRDRISRGESPIWRGHRLDDDNQLRRDIMFSFKNAPELNLQLFAEKYGTDPLRRFPNILGQLQYLGLIQTSPDSVRLTPKGRLCVEEICALFADTELPGKGDPGRNTQEQYKIEKHNFSPSYRRLPQAP